MSTVASSSIAVVISNSNSSGICKKPAKRPSGTFRVLTDDYSQFSLFDDFDNDFHEILTDYDRYEPVKPDPEQDELFVGCRDNASNCLKGKPKNDILSESHVLYHVKKISRLTDEVEIDGNSMSDELDLLPPLPRYSDSKRKFPKWKIKLPNWLLCRNPPIQMKCTVM